jgi:hypothetical protein
MNSITKTAANLKIGDILIIKNQPIKVVGVWGLAVSLDMYVNDEHNATSYIANRKINLKEDTSFTVLENQNNLSLFEIKQLLHN